VCVREELGTTLVQPALGRAIAKLLPDGIGAPVLRFLGNEVTALDEEDAGAGGGEGTRHGSTTGAAAHDHEIERLSHRAT
jgi:hypothetical protein